jgi:hypothetical protein
MLALRAACAVAQKIKYLDNKANCKSFYYDIILDGLLF